MEVRKQIKADVQRTQDAIPVAATPAAAQPIRIPDSQVRSWSDDIDVVISKILLAHNDDEQENP